MKRVWFFPVHIYTHTSFAIQFLNNSILYLIFFSFLFVCFLCLSLSPSLFTHHDYELKVCDSRWIQPFSIQFNLRKITQNGNLILLISCEKFTYKASIENRTSITLKNFNPKWMEFHRNECAASVSVWNMGSEIAWQRQKLPIVLAVYYFGVNWISIRYILDI